MIASTIGFDEFAMETLSDVGGERSPRWPRRSQMMI